MTEEEDYECTYSPRTVKCDWCGKVFKGRRSGQGYVYCPDCKKIIAESKDIERRNKEYKITHRWSQREPQITEALKSAKEKGMSYGQYVAMKKAGWI